MTFVSTGINCGAAPRAVRAQGQGCGGQGRLRDKTPTGGVAWGCLACYAPPTSPASRNLLLGQLRFRELRELRRSFAAVLSRHVEPVERLRIVVAVLIPEPRELLGGAFVAGLRVGFQLAVLRPLSGRSASPPAWPCHDDARSPSAMPARAARASMLWAFEIEGWRARRAHSEKAARRKAIRRPGPRAQALRLKAWKRNGGKAFRPGTLEWDPAEPPEIWADEESSLSSALVPRRVRLIPSGPPASTSTPAGAPAPRAWAPGSPPGESPSLRRGPGCLWRSDARGRLRCWRRGESPRVPAG